MSLTAFSAGSDGSAITSYLENDEIEAQRLEDYYVEKGQAQTQLIGSGWTAVGSDTAYSSERVHHVLAGRNPVTGEAIDGMTDNRRPGYDATFSADKSVSLAWAAGDDETRAGIELAHQAAVERTIKYMESQLAVANVGKGGKIREKGKLFAAEYHHGSSREGDPDLHTHVMIANLVVRESDGKLMSLNSRDMYARQRELGAIYRAELAAGLKEQGYQIEKHGKENELIRIAGSPKAVERAFSKSREALTSRSQEVEDLMAARGISRARALEYINLDSRHSKEPLDPSETRQRWQKELSEHGYTQETINNFKQLEEIDNVRNHTQKSNLSPAARAPQNGLRRLPECNLANRVRYSAVESLLHADTRDTDREPGGVRWGAAHLATRRDDFDAGFARQSQPTIDEQAVLRAATDKKSVVTEQELRESFVFAAAGVLNVDEIEQQFDRLLENEELVEMRRLGAANDYGDREIQRAFTTREMLQTEQDMVENAQLLKTRQNLALDSDALKRHQAEYETRSGHTLTDDQRAALVAATTQRDMVLIEGHAGTGKTTLLEVAGNAWRERGLDVRGCAVSGKAAGELGKSGIESQTIASLLRQAKPSVDDNGFVRPPKNPLTAHSIVVVDEAGMTGSRDMHELTGACRDAGAKLVVVGDRRQLQSVSAGGAMSALAGKLEIDASLTTVMRQRDRPDLLAAVTHQRFGESRKALDILQQRGSVQMAEDKELAVQTVVERWQSHYRHDSPDASKSSVMLANSNADAARLNQQARHILRAQNALGDDHELVVSDRTGTVEKNLTVAENDRVVFLKNQRFGTQYGAPSVKNGQTARVMAIDDKMMTVALEDTNKTLSIDTSKYNHIDHAYALTTHKSQGMTVDHAAILAGGAMQTLNQSYVQMSRCKQDIDLVMPRNQLDEAMELVDPTAKMTELAQRTAAEKGLTLDADSQNFRECRDFLNAHAYPVDELESDRWKRDLGNLVDRMETLDLKETTFDYRIVQPSEVEHELDIVQQPPAQEQEMAMGWGWG